MLGLGESAGRRLSGTKNRKAWGDESNKMVSATSST